MGWEDVCEDYDEFLVRAQVVNVVDDASWMDGWMDAVDAE
ncbi:unnamed protein product [Anisakis simplex]|uniref:Prophage protein n=1 Tax=Anisakis simplex TaxID=6269 RepID=A0A0M3JIL4_ANISI|nr:unnamed protein product [Anisakis simplex]